MIASAAHGSPEQKAQPDLFYYRAYDLVFESEIELPELETTSKREPDVVIRLKSIAPSEAGVSLNDGTTFDFSDDGYFLSWSVVGRFLIRNVHTIDVEPDGAQSGLIRLPLLGPVMALLLHLRGNLVLHASAVAVNGQGIVFMGDKGAGKSTTAAALISAGHRLLTDDIVAIRFEADGAPVICPAFPQVKLMEDAAAQISLPDAVSRPLFDSPDIGPNKTQHRLQRRFDQEPTPLSKIFVLGRAASPSVQPLEVNDRWMALMRFSYITRFAYVQSRMPLAQSHMKQCASLAKSVDVAKLNVALGLDKLAENVAFVERQTLPSDARAEQ